MHTYTQTKTKQSQQPQQQKLFKNGNQNIKAVREKHPSKLKGVKKSIEYPEFIL